MNTKLKRLLSRLRQPDKPERTIPKASGNVKPIFSELGHGELLRALADDFEQGRIPELVVLYGDSNSYYRWRWCSGKLSRIVYLMDIAKFQLLRDHVFGEIE